MRGFRFGLIGVTCCVAGCIGWHPRIYRGVPLVSVVNDFQLYSPKKIVLDRGLRSIRVTARINAPPFDKGVEDFVYGLPNFLPVTIEENAYSYHVHCVRADCQWPSPPP